MIDKRGWIRIVEAFVAIMIISVALIYFSANKETYNISEEVYEKQKSLLNIMANNESLRNELIGVNIPPNGCVKIDKDDPYLFIELIKNTLPQTWEFIINICGINQISNEGIPADREIYISEGLITANYTDFPDNEVRKIRFLVWGK